MAACVFRAALLRADSYKPSSLVPPQPTREFRAAWVASVNNIDWPSTNTLSVSQQKAELVEILDQVSRLKLNAIILQIRPACDALYPSKLEPWSEYLTGTMGVAPEPFYDPLAFAVEQAHKRGLQLHAWFNPYRAHHSAGKSPIARNHVSRVHPELVRQYGNQLWLDPGEKAVQDYSLAVVMDVVRRYDIDGVHFDDYFYPYKEKNGGGNELDFPDEASWKKYGAGKGIDRADWRRQNVNVFIQRVNNSVKSAKPWVMFGVSPFGIWRPGYPAQIKGFDAYDKLYADARLWLVNGWLDYLAPQLYWAIRPPEQSFPVLLDWWASQNPKNRHIWPGLNSCNVGRMWKPDEIVSQIQLTRREARTAGHIHWDVRNGLMRRNGLESALQQTYSRPALAPSCPWVPSTPPSKPRLLAQLRSSGTRITWATERASKAFLWVVQTKRGSQWRTEVLPGNRTTQVLKAPRPEAISVSEVDRYGNVGTATSVELRP
jgi:uncharacterized lipoprotein YddW (UPF0748 family)